jgi:hypothetical protein
VQTFGGRTSGRSKADPFANDSQWKKQVLNGSLGGNIEVATRRVIYLTG